MSVAAPPEIAGPASSGPGKKVRKLPLNVRTVLQEKPQRNLCQAYNREKTLYEAACALGIGVTVTTMQALLEGTRVKKTSLQACLSTLLCLPLCICVPSLLLGNQHQD